MYQMIAFDMDGTLHGGTGEVFQSAAGIYYLTFSSIRYCERSRKLFKAHISALFLFLSFISSSIFRKRNSIFFSISIDICLKLCGRVW